MAADHSHVRWTRLHAEGYFTSQYCHIQNIIVTIEQTMRFRQRMSFLQNESAARCFIRIAECNINELYNGYGVINVFNDDNLHVQYFILHNNVIYDFF